MAFLSPAVLWALAALAIPVLLHLFYFRRYRRVAFSDVRFLREVREETQNRSRLRNLLVLALRLLAFAALVLAFAQPLTRGDAQLARRDRETVAVYVDNSFSMSARGEEVSLLETARQRAREVIGAYGDDAEFQLLTNELGGNASRTLSREDALAAVTEIAPTAESRDLATLISRLRPDADPVFLFTDAQASQFGSLTSATPPLDTSRELRFVRVEPVAARNVSVDTVMLVNPVQLAGEPTELIVALTNHGQSPAEAVRLSARLQGRQQPFGTREVPALTTLRDTLRLAASSAGPTEVTVEITDFPVEFDNAYRVAFEVRDRLRGLSIGGSQPNRYLTAAFPAGGGLTFEHAPAGAVAYNALREYDLVVLEDLPQVSSGLARALSEYAAGGGKVLVFPNPEGEPADLRPLTAPAGLPGLSNFEVGSFEGGRLNAAAFEFADVFERLPRNLSLPTAEGRFAVAGRGGETLLSFRDGAPLMLAGDIGSGRVYLATVPLDPELSGLVASGEVFVPMVYRMALAGRAARPAAYTIGSTAAATFPLPAEIGEAAVRLVGEGAEYVPAQRRLGNELVVTFGEAPDRPGFYRLVDGADSTLAHVAFNADRRESPQDFLSADDIADAGYVVYDGTRRGTLGAAVEADVQGRPWWPLLVAFGLACLLAEALVLRFWRPGRAPRASTQVPA